LVWGVIPEEFFSKLDGPSHISWQSHLSGAFIGVIMAFLLRNTGDKKKRFDWENPNYKSEYDEELWREYREKYPEDFHEPPDKKKENIWEHLDEIIKKNR
jgi:hypothetical protein